jgi:pyridoxamine 5'-phosphate oxidase
MDLKDIKLEYNREELNLDNLATTPFEQINKWFSQALKAEISYANAATLSTVSKNQIPSSRIVLIKEIKSSGITFFTNFESDKSQDISSNSTVSLLFFWKELDRQIRITGKASKVSREESKEYFASRPKDSQISALASHQSKPVSKESLYSKVSDLSTEYTDKIVPCPENWGGYLVSYEEIEIWQGRPNRLHDRFCYKSNGGSWKISRLSP